MANMKGSETSAAIAAALSAFPEWKSKVAKERSKVMRKWCDEGLCRDLGHPWRPVCFWAGCLVLVPAHICSSMTADICGSMLCVVAL